MHEHQCISVTRLVHTQGPIKNISAMQVVLDVCLFVIELSWFLSPISLILYESYTFDLLSCTCAFAANPLAFGWINSPSSRCFDISLDFKALDQSASSSILTFPAEGGSEHGSRSAACFPSKCTPEGHHMLTIQGYELRCRTGINAHEI